MGVLTINNKEKRLLKMIGFLLALLLIYVSFLPMDNENDYNNANLNEINENLKLSGTSGKINIVGEQGWIDFRNAGNCTGSGSYLDPFVIEDLIIDGQGSGSGIKITLSRNFFFRIENCTIFNCSYGIELYSTDNGTMYQNDCSFNGVGIYLHCPDPFSIETYGCFNNTIIENIANNNSLYGFHLNTHTTGNLINNTANNNIRGIYHQGYPYIISRNTANNNEIGISIWGPGGNGKLSRNIAIDNRDSGIDLNSFGFNLTGNFMKGSGLMLGSSSIETLSTIHIDITNLVNSKPIYYLINRTGIFHQNFEDAGQIFLINCANILVKDMNVSNSSMGIAIYDSNNITVLNAVSSNNEYGVYLRNTNYSYFIDNTFKYNKYGNYFSGINNTVEGNYIYSNTWKTREGLTFASYDDYNKIINNEIIGCIMGLVLRLSSHNLISGNIIRDNYYGIVVMGGSEYNHFYENFFIGNNKHTDGGSATNKWNNTEIGNYWDNYTGPDNDGDGIGDIPHIIVNYPLTFDYLPIVDNDAPNITIISPMNFSIYGIKAPSFNVSINERYIDEMWYSLDGGITNISFTEFIGTIDQSLWDLLPEGDVIISFYANDTLGRIGFREVSVIKDTSQPTPPGIPGYDLIFLIGIITIMVVVMLKRRANR